MYDIEAIYEAESPAHAVELLQKYSQSVIIAGGTDVLIKIREGMLAGCTLISIQKLDELRGVSIDTNGTIRIGSLSSFSHISKDPIICKYIPTLAEAVETIGGPQIRNIGTIGGNICNNCNGYNGHSTCKGITSADSAPTLLAFDAVLEYLGPCGKRLVPIKEHYVGRGGTALKNDEILQAIIISKESYENCFGDYIKYATRNAMDIAILNCSANVTLSNDRKTIERLRIAYGVAEAIPIRAYSAEKTIEGKPITSEIVTLAAQAALNDINPRTSWRAQKEFRIHLAKELAKRSITESLKRAGVLL